MNAVSETEILLVEDSPYDAEMTLRALQKRHLANKIFHVKDGEEALEFLFGTGQYASRADCQHPKVDGFDFLRAIRSNERTKCIPVVVLTSSHEQRDLVESYKLGVNSYIVKPVQFENFSEAVAEVGC